MGLGYNGMQPDAPKHNVNPGNPTNPDVGCDAFDMLDDYYTTIPVKFEPNFVSDRSARRDQYEYWSWLWRLSIR